MVRLCVLAAEGFQDQLNPNLVSISKADYTLGSRISVHLPDNRNQVLDPFTEDGRERQQQRLVDHMINTVVGETTVKDNGKTVRTLDMLDGSRQVYTRYDRCKNGDAETFQYYGPGGKLVATVTQHANGSSTAVLVREGCSSVTVTTDPEGRSTAHDDGKDFILPKNDFFTHPELTLAGGGVSAIESGSSKGFPFMTAAQSENLRIGSKIAGPALGVATTIYDVVNAEGSYNKCAAGFSGTGGTVGSWALASLGAQSPWSAAGFAVVGAWGGGYLGTLVGERVCE